MAKLELFFFLINFFKKLYKLNLPVINMYNINKKLLPKEIIKEIEKDNEIITVFVFGSYIHNKKYSRDIDLCIVLDKKYSNLEMSRKKIKYASLFSRKFDVSLFQQLPMYIRIRVLKEGKILFCKDEDKLYGLAFSTIKEFEYYKKIYYTYLKSIEK